MHTTDKPHQMSIREFRAAVKSTMRLPVAVYSDGELAFVVVSPDTLRQFLAPIQGPCPRCGAPITARRNVRTTQPVA